MVPCITFTKESLQKPHIYQTHTDKESKTLFSPFSWPQTDAIKFEKKKCLSEIIHLENSLSVGNVIGYMEKYKSVSHSFSSSVERVPK